MRLVPSGVLSAVQTIQGQWLKFVAYGEYEINSSMMKNRIFIRINVYYIYKSICTDYAM